MIMPVITVMIVVFLMGMTAMHRCRILRAIVSMPHVSILELTS
jgi:hypothetical protein